MSKLTSWLAHELPKYWKAAIAVVPVVLFVGAEVVQAASNGAADGTLTVGDVYTIIVVGVTAYAVYRKRNADPDS